MVPNIGIKGVPFNTGPFSFFTAKKRWLWPAPRWHWNGVPCMRLLICAVVKCDREWSSNSSNRRNNDEGGAEWSLPEGRRSPAANVRVAIIFDSCFPSESTVYFL